MKYYKVIYRTDIHPICVQTFFNLDKAIEFAERWNGLIQDSEYNFIDWRRK